MEIVKKCYKHGDLQEYQCFIRTEKRWGINPKKSYSCRLCKKLSSDKYTSTKSYKEKKKKNQKNSGKKIEIKYCKQEEYGKKKIEIK